MDSSHHTLTPLEQVVHRRLAVLPGPFTSDAAAALITEVTEADVEDALAQLVHRSMLTSTAATGPAGRTVFRQLATVRAHAVHRLGHADESDAAVRLRNSWMRDVIEGRPRLGSTAEVEWFARVDANDATLRAVLASALIDDPDPLGARLVAPLSFYWYYRAKVTEATRWLRLACDAVPDRADVRWLTSTLVLSAALATQGRVDAARPHIREALAALPAVEDEHLVEVGESLVALGAGVWVHQVFDLVIDVHAALTVLANRAGDDVLALFAAAFGCMAMAVDGRMDEAAAHAATVYREAEAQGNITAGWIAAAMPMTVAVLNAQPETGIPWVRRVMRAHLRVGGRTAGMFIETRANYETQRRSHRDAARLYSAARAHTRQAAMVWPRRPITHALLDETRARLSQRDFEQAWHEGEQMTLEDVVALD